MDIIKCISPEWPSMVRLVRRALEVWARVMIGREASARDFLNGPVHSLDTVPEINGSFQLSMHEGMNEAVSSAMCGHRCPNGVSQTPSPTRPE